MTNWYCSSVDYAAVAQYATTHVYAAGAIVRQLATPTVGNERCLRTAAGGTTGSAEPAWTLTKGSTTTDSGGVVWTEVTGNQTYQSPGAWAAPHARLMNATNQGWMASGDTVYVAANHAETQSSSMTISVSNLGANLCFIVCVDNSASGSVPPQSGNIRTTATVSTTGNASISWEGNFSYCYGVTFSAASGSSLGYGIILGYAGSGQFWQKFEACAFKLLSTGSSTVSMGQNSGGYMEWDNVAVTFTAGASSGISPSGCFFVWRGGSTTVVTTTPNSILTAGGNAHMLCDSVDFSAMNPVHLVGSLESGCVVSLVNSKLASGQSIYNGPALYAGSVVDVISTDSAAVAYRQERQAYEGVLTTSTSAIRTGGASDGTTGISWQIVTSAYSCWPDSFESFVIAQWNAVTASNVPVTVCGIANVATIPNNDDIWIEARYLGNAGAPLDLFVTGTKANILASNAALAVDTSAWDSAATQRANSHINAVGDVIAVSANPGRLFFCTTGGTTASAVPGGYASAVDGGSVTDGTTTFRAGLRFQLTATLTSPAPQMAGYVRVTVRVAKVSTTFFIDPLITL